MPPFSMNSHATAHSSRALSDHSLTVLRPLLRSIAMWHRKRTRLVPLDPDLEFDDINVEDSPDPELPTNKTFDRALNGPYEATPVALAMTQHEIETAIAAGRDPWAEATDKREASPKEPSLSQPPIPSLIVAARLAAVLSDATILSSVTAPRAFSLITIPDRSERKAAWKDVGNVLQRLADLSNASDDTWRGFDTPVCAEESGQTKGRGSSRRNDYEDAVEVAVKNGHKVFALAPDANSMSPVTRAMCGLVLDWPPLSGQMIIETLRVTHTSTGELSVDALAELLPPDSDVAALPLPVIESVFLEATTLKVAQALATAAARFRALPPAATTLNDIVLNESVRAPVNRLISDIASWTTGQLPWSEVSSSILFHGPPGNGKTLLASALAGSSQVPLISTSYSDCQKHGHQGDMLRALSAKVDETVCSAPSVFFLDELDGFTHRNRSGRNSDYIVGVVNALLEHLSRLNDTPGVVVLGATNYPDMIDPAVLRPGRFDQKIEITNPDKASVLNILELTLGRDTKDMIFSPIADQLLGSSGAKVAAFVREARGLAREEQRPLDQCHLETAATHICPALPPDVLWRVAVHEAGHLVVAYELGLPSAAGAAVTSTGGFVDIPSPQLESAQSAKDRIVALLGGRAAEKIILGEAFNGAGLGENSDLELATRLAEQIHSQWGFGDQLAYRELNKDPLNSQGSMQIEPAMQKAQGSALQIVEQKLELVIKIANALLIERELTAAQIQSLLEHDSPSNLTVSSN